MDTPDFPSGAFVVVRLLLIAGFETFT